MQKRFRSIKESPSAGPEETEESRMMETMSSSGQNRKVNFQVKLELHPSQKKEMGSVVPALLCAICSPILFQETDWAERLQPFTAVREWDHLF